MCGLDYFAVLGQAYSHDKFRFQHLMELIVSLIGFIANQVFSKLTFFVFLAIQLENVGLIQIHSLALSSAITNL